MAACLKHPHRFHLLMLLTVLHRIHLVSCSCISASEQNLHVNLESGKFFVINVDRHGVTGYDVHIIHSL